MRIQLDSVNCCTSIHCIFRKTCAQHKSAGDYRSEGGFAPEIRRLDNVADPSHVNCLTADMAHTESVEGCLPINVEYLPYGYRANPIIGNNYMKVKRSIDSLAALLDDASRDYSDSQFQEIEKLIERLTTLLTTATDSPSINLS